MKIQAIVTQSTTDSAPLINFANSNVDQVGFLEISGKNDLKSLYSNNYFHNCF